MTRWSMMVAAAMMSAGPVAAAAPAAASPAYRDAREQAPPALLGLWRVDLARSHFTGARPQAALRSFQSTEGGRLLVTFMTWGATGAYSTGHWAAQVDGTPGIEYHSAAGAIPYNVVRLTKVDDRTLNLTVGRHGKTDIEAVYALSVDDATLTYSYDGNVVVYHRLTRLD